MRQRNADRWDLLVEKLVRQQDDDPYFHGSFVAQLLRREHRAVVRIVKALAAQYTTTDGDSGAEELLRDLLDHLKRRAR